MHVHGLRFFYSILSIKEEVQIIGVESQIERAEEQIKERYLK